MTWEKLIFGCKHFLIMTFERKRKNENQYLLLANGSYVLLCVSKLFSTVFKTVFWIIFELIMCEKSNKK